LAPRNKTSDEGEACALISIKMGRATAATLPRASPLIWIDITWRNNAALGGIDVTGDADVDPWIFSAGLGYRFNLFGATAQAAPIK